MCHIICIYVAICNGLSASSFSMGLKTPLTPYTLNVQHKEATIFLANQAQTLGTVFVDNYIYDIVILHTVFLSF